MPASRPSLARFAVFLACSLVAPTSWAQERPHGESTGSFWSRMPTAKKATVLSLLGLGAVGSVGWLYWGFDGNSHQDKADDFRLSHGSVANVCGANNVGCPSYASEHLAAEKAASYQKVYLVGWIGLEAAGLVTLFVWPNTETSVTVGAGSMNVKGSF